jgi:hypothetical protein
MRLASIRLGSESMKRLNVLWLLLSVQFLCGCAPVPGHGNVPVDMGEWCSRDDRMPWTGCWTEVARIDCESESELEPEEPIGEFRLTPVWRDFRQMATYSWNSDAIGGGGEA